MKTSEVFIPGGLPTVTYNSRVNFELEKKLIEFIDEGHKLVSVTGSTKSGKTVLCNKLIPEDNCVFASGGSINSEKDLWEFILNDLGVDIEDSTSISESTSTEGSSEVNSGIGIPKVLSLGSKLGEKSIDSKQRSKTSKKISNLQSIALNSLIDRNVALLIDDFHYISPDVQQRIVRAIKQPIFKGLRAIILAVPHRAFDSVKVEAEMTGRVVQLPIPNWEPDELKVIARQGFEELNVVCDESIINRLADESYSSPHLMQEFCLRLCKFNGVDETQEDTFELKEPDWTDFFKRIVDSISSKVAFERLARGPRQRADRVQRTLISGEKVDIYTAILHGIADTGPTTQIEYEQLRASMRKVLSDKTPQSQEITRVLSKMDEIAVNELEGEPVIDWDKETTKLYISDPFFAFYLKWKINK